MAHTARTTQQLLAEFWTPSGLAAIFAGLEHTRLLYLAHSQAKVQAMPHANLAFLHPSIVTEFDRFAAEYICKTCWLFLYHLEAILAKNGAYIEDGQHESEIHQPALFGTTIRLKKRLISLH